MGNSIFKRNNRIHSEIYNIDYEENENNYNTIEKEIAYIDETKIIYNYTQCVICLDPISGITLNCGHSDFCYSCIESLIIYNKNNGISTTCPLCRELVTHVNLNYNLTFNVT
tara:strand:- start:2161 stop:2496 length:336 start_codon:yes stop_codon:yes gene_type:complete